MHAYISERARLLAWLILAAAGLGWLMLHKLGSLTGGLSSGEVTAATAPVGWHGIYHQPLYLPLNIVRSIVFYASPAHGQMLTRLPNAVFGALAILAFFWLVKLWHGTRTAVMAGLMFACGAWILHASRLASFDVLYLWATPTLLLTHVLLHRYKDYRLVWYGSLIAWGLLIYVPGMVWLVLAEIYLQRADLAAAWRAANRFWLRAAYLLLGLIWLPLLGLYIRHLDNLLYWLGWPASPRHLLKQFAAVPVHLFVRGPQYPDIWLARAPILDIFALAACAIGIYFYLTHINAARSRLLAVMALLGFILVGLGGAVSLSLLVPLLYVAAATGIAYLLREWLGVFPNNPLARGLGIGLVSLAVALSCFYNLRAYFIVWPHNQATQTVFKYHR